MKKLLLIAFLMLTVVFAAVACTGEPSEPADTTVAETDAETTAEAGDETTVATGDETTAEAGDETTAEAGDETTAEAGDETTVRSEPVIEPTETVAVPDNAVNVAVGASVYAASEYVEAGFFSPGYLVDGIRGGDSRWGWSSSIEMAPPSDFSITLVLSDVYTLYGITLVPVKMCAGEGFPSAYEVAVSADGLNWTTVVTASGVDAKAETPDEVQPLVHGFAEAIDALYVNITIKEFSDTQNGIEVARIGDIELAGTFLNVGSDPVVIPDVLVNLAVGLMPDVPTSLEMPPVFSLAYLTDGIYTNDGSDNYISYVTHTTQAPPEEFYITFDLGDVTTLYRAIIRPGHAYSGGAFPKSYILQASADGDTWKTVVIEANAQLDVESETVIAPFVYDFATAVEARYFRMKIVAHGDIYADTGIPYSAIGEIEILGECDGPVNVAIGAQITATNTWDMADFFGAGFLNDGYYGTEGNKRLGWFCQPGTPVGDLYVTLALSGVYTIDRIVLKPFPVWDGGGFPGAYELQVSMDGETWETVVTASDMAAEGAVNGAEYTLTTPVQAKYVRLQILEHGIPVHDGSFDMRSGFGEFEVWGMPVTD